MTLDGRIKMSFQLAEYYKQYLSWDRTSADLIQDRKGHWWLHVVVETTASIVITIEETVVCSSGFDCGSGSVGFVVLVETQNLASGCDRVLPAPNPKRPNAATVPALQIDDSSRSKSDSRLRKRFG